MGSKSVSTTSARKTSSPSIEQKIKSLYTALQVADKQQEKRGLQFGQAMYKYREEHSAQGKRLDLVSVETKLETFEVFCDRLEISRATAYRWITRYEESVGERPIPTPSAAPVVKYIPEPDPVPEPPSKAPMTVEERDNQQLRDFTHRLVSVTSAMKTLIANGASECTEYPNVVKAAQALAKVIKTL